MDEGLRRNEAGLSSGGWFPVGVGFFAGLWLGIIFWGRVGTQITGGLEARAGNRIDVDK